MKLLLGSLLLAGICWLAAAMEFSTMANFKFKKILGNWIPLANIVIENQFYEYTLKASRKGMSYSFNHLLDGKCKTKKFQLTEQGKGKFKVLSPVFIQVLDTDYETYIISYIERGMYTFLSLAGKEQVMSSELETKFKEFANSVGVTEEIVPVMLAESC